MRPGSRLLSFLLVLTVAFLSFVFIELGIDAVAVKVKPPFHVGDKLQEKRLYSHEKGIFYIGEIKDNEINGFAAISTNPPSGKGAAGEGAAGEGATGEDAAGEDAAEKSAIQYIPQARMRTDTENNLIYLDSLWGTLNIPANTIERRVFKPVSALQRFFDDYQKVNSDLQSFMRSQRWEFYLLCFSLVFFALTSGMWMRITRWPVFNFLVVLLVLRGGFFLYALLREDLVKELGKLLTDSLLVRILPTLSLLAIGVLFFLIDLLFVPYESIREEA
jgi:hypothetical protein